MKKKQTSVAISVDGKQVELDHNALGRAITSLASTADHAKISLPDFIGILEGIKHDVIWKKLKEPKKAEFKRYRGKTKDGHLCVDSPEALSFLIRALVWESTKSMPSDQVIGVLEILKMDTITANQDIAKQEMANKAAEAANGSMYG